MAIPLIYTIGFTKGLRAALPFLEALVTRNPIASTQSILTAARGMGLRFTDDPARTLVKQLKVNQEVLKRFKALIPTEEPNDSDMGEGVGLLDKNYSYVVEVTGYNRAKGERESYGLTISSDDLMSLHEIEDTALTMNSEEPGYQLEKAVVDIKRAVKSKALRGRL